jgi:molybdenum cofactor cytidylyltransferase
MVQKKRKTRALKQPASFALGAVILAAGRSARMGKPKLLLPWGNTSILGYLIQQWKKLGAQQITIVCAANDQAMQTELRRLGFPTRDCIYNPAPGRGMFSSIQCAAAWTEWKTELTHWALILGDQPHLRNDTLHKLVVLSAVQQTKVCQPSHQGKRRHPVVLPGNVFARLISTHATDLKQFLAGCEIAECPSDDPGLDLDIDRPEDYAKAQAGAGLGNT